VWRAQDSGPPWFDGHQAQPAGESFILRACDLPGLHALRQALGFLPRICHHGFFYTGVDALLRAKGSAHKPIEPCHFQKETNETNPTRANLDEHHM
jgi:hypothetical protein